MTSPNTKLDALWMPYTANRAFKKKPRMIVAAEGNYYHTSDCAHTSLKIARAYWRVLGQMTYYFYPTSSSCHIQQTRSPVTGTA